MVVSPKTTTVKFLCSYGGKILPRYPDGKLRYHGGHTRVLAVDRSVSFSELTAKMAEMCGSPVILRCQFPNEDLDALVSLTSDEDLANLVEEYDRVYAAAMSLSSTPLKIRAFLYPPKTLPPVTASPSEPSSTSSSPSSSPSSSLSPRSSAKPPLPPSPPRVAARIPYYGCYAHRKPSHINLIHNGNYWQ